MRAAVWNSSAVVTVSWNAVLDARRPLLASMAPSVSTFYLTTSSATVVTASAARCASSRSSPTCAPGHLAPRGRRAAPPTTTASSASARRGDAVPAASTRVRSGPCPTPLSRSSSTRRHLPSRSWYRVNADRWRPYHIAATEHNWTEPTRSLQFCLGLSRLCERVFMLFMLCHGVLSAQPAQTRPARHYSTRTNKTCNYKSQATQIKHRNTCRICTIQYNTIQWIFLESRDVYARWVQRRLGRLRYVLRIKSCCKQCGFQSWFEDGQAVT